MSYVHCLRFYIRLTRNILCWLNLMMQIFYFVFVINGRYINHCIVESNQIRIVYSMQCEICFQCSMVELFYFVVQSLSDVSDMFAHQCFFFVLFLNFFCQT